MSYLINQSVNYKGDCKTAPAIPGLLIMLCLLLCYRTSGNDLE